MTENMIMQKTSPNGSQIEGITFGSVITSNHLQEQGILVGNRIPKDYFITQGRGESDITVHAGSYHLALKQAGIEMSNIMTYSSILPAIATEVPKPDRIVHGSVMETIMAVSNSVDGERVSAGIIFGWLFDKKTNQRYGGLVCEHNGNYTNEHIEWLLRSSLNELYINGFDDQFELRDMKLTIESFEPKKKFATAIVALCFTNYFYPVLQYNTTVLYQ